MCRLYLISDILHNSTVPVRNASRYRQLIQNDMPAVFLSLGAVLLKSEDVIGREAFKRCTLRVLRVWKDWYLFSEEFLAGLQSSFLLERTPEWRKACPDQVQVLCCTHCREM
jgi:U2-associated protein SR140